VRIVSVAQLESRVLLVNVSAVVKMPAQTDQMAADKTQELSADQLVQRLVDDPNTFLRTTKTLGADSATVTDVTLQFSGPREGHAIPLHAVLWPALVGGLLFLALAGYACRRALRGRRRGPALSPGLLGLRYAWGRWSSRSSHCSDSDSGLGCGLGQEGEVELQGFASPLAASYATRLRSKQMLTAGASSQGGPDVYGDILRGGR
jgi:hypothetical protein